MTRLTVISDSRSDSVLAACTASEGKPGAAGLSELLGSVLLIAVGHQDIELDAATDLEAHEIPSAAIDLVVPDPTAFYVSRGSPQNPQVTLETTAGDTTMTFAGHDVTLTVPAPDQLPRQAWIIVMRGAQAPRRMDGTIPSTLTQITFSGVVRSGDRVIALVVKHRPAFQIVP